MAKKISFLFAVVLFISAAVFNFALQRHIQNAITFTPANLYA